MADPRSLWRTCDVITHVFTTTHVWRRGILLCHILPYLAMVKNPWINSEVQIRFGIRIILDALYLCLSVCLSVLAIMALHSNAKGQPQWNVWSTILKHRRLRPTATLVKDVKLRSKDGSGKRGRPGKTGIRTPQSGLGGTSRGWAGNYWLLSLSKWKCYYILIILETGDIQRHSALREYGNIKMLYFI